MIFNQHTRSFATLMKPAMLLFLSVCIGVAGFMTIEQYSLLDALYMSMLTLSTVGYEVVRPLSNTGKLFTVFYLAMNIGLIAYFITIFTRYLMDGEFIKRYKQLKMESRIKRLQQHVIICGLGRNGRESAQILYNNHVPFVVIEVKEDPELNGKLPIEHFIRGNATSDEILQEAGIQRAKALITTLPVDADNLFLVLTAKQLNPAIKVISRASVNSSVQKLKIAGADNVIMPDKIGGAHMATLVLQPDVTELISIMSATSNPDFRMKELPVSKSILLADLDLWKNTHCTIIGIKKKNNHYSMNPSPDHAIMEGDRLIVMGSDEQLEKALKMVSE